MGNVRTRYVPASAAERSNDVMAASEVRVGPQAGPTIRQSLAFRKYWLYLRSMTRLRAGGRSHCPVSFALDVFGDRWTLLVIRDLLLRGKKTYGEFLASEEGMATNVLADR